MFKKLSTVTGIFLLSSVVLSAGKAQAQLTQVYEFENFNPGGGDISAGGFFTVTDTSDFGVVNFPNEFQDWNITLTNSSNGDTATLTPANSELNTVDIDVDVTTILTGVETEVSVTLPYLDNVSVDSTDVDFSTASDLIAGSFQIQSTDSLVDNQFLLINAVNVGDLIDNPLVTVGSLPDTVTETLVLNGIQSSVDVLNGDLTFQAVAQDSTAVPFEFTPSLGILIAGAMWWGVSRYKKQAQANQTGV